MAPFCLSGVRKEMRNKLSQPVSNVGASLPPLPLPILQMQNFLAF